MCRYCGQAPENVAFHESFECEKNTDALVKCKYCYLPMTKLQYTEGHLAKCSELQKILIENERLAKQVAELQRQVSENSALEAARQRV
jgi:hypothetical protein